MLDAQAVRENVVRLYFSTAVRFTGILDPNDAASAARYDVTPITGTSGLDGLPTRDVDAIAVELVRVPGAGGAQLDVVVDRPFTPWPSEYRVSASQILAHDGSLLDPAHASFVFAGVFKGLAVMKPDLAVARKDFANPQTLSGLLESGGVKPDGQEQGKLGSFFVDDTGDYAVDQGIASYRKRVFRRLTTRKGSFAHLPNYGVGIPDQIKSLSKAGLRESIAADAEEQIRREPETAAVSVVLVNDRNRPDVVVLRVRARTTHGDNVTDDIPLSTVGL